MLVCKTKHTRRLEQEVFQHEGSIPSDSTNFRVGMKKISKKFRQGGTGSVKLTQIKPRVYHAVFDDAYSLCMTILRIHEHSENPKFKNKSFTYEQYMDWYSKEHGKGHFTFDKDYLGFSINSPSFRHFVKNFPKKEWTEKEKKYIEEAIRLVGKDDFESQKRFCIINSFEKKKSSVFRHELAHAIYYVDSNYKHAADKFFKSLKSDFKKKVISIVKDDGYPELQVLDEINARLSTERTFSAFGGEDKELKYRGSKSIMREARRLFEEYLDRHPDHKELED